MREWISNKGLALAMGLMAAAYAAVPASAQTHMRVNIPFAFTAGETSLPAGEYRVAVDESFRRMELQPVQKNGWYAVMVSSGSASRTATKSNDGVLQFQKIGDRYILATVWQPDRQLGNKVALPKSAKEAGLTNGAIPVINVVAK